MKKQFIWLLVSILFFTLMPLDLVAKEKFTVGRDPVWAPLNFRNKTSYINAFIEALFEQISLTERVNFDVVQADFVYLFQGLEEEWYQGILNSVNPNSETTGYFDFSDPILFLGPVLIVPNDSKVTSLSELDGKTVGISPFDRSVLIVQKYPSIIIANYENMPTALEDLALGKIEGVLLGILDAKYLLEDGEHAALKIVTKPLNDEAIRLITLKGKENKMLKIFNRGLRKNQKKGIYSRLLKKFELNSK